MFSRPTAHRVILIREKAVTVSVAEVDADVF